MNELFNWGEETPEQRQARLQWEHELLLEQARKRFNMIVMTGGAAGGGGAPSGDRLECDPAKGIGVYLTFDLGEGSPFGILTSLARMEYQGDDEVGQPTYASTLIPEQFEFTLSYDYGVGKWKFMVSLFPESPYYSDTLIGSNWIQSNPQEGNPIISTECGYRELPVYCIDAGELGLIQPFPTWLESQNTNTEVPPIWFAFDVAAIWLPIIQPGNDGWFFPVGEAEGGVFGGSINELPLGEVALSGGNYVTVSEGACSSIACQPTGGLIINLDLSGFITEGVSGRYFIGAQGVENDKVFYLSYDKEIDAGDEFESWIKVSWNSDTELWEFIQYYAENGEIVFQETIATSPDLYNSEWTMLIEDFPPIGTSPGTEFSCDWRYCITFGDDDYSFNGSSVPTWFEVPLNESPNAYLTFGGGNNIFWSPEDSSWLVDIGPEPVPIGGTITTLPTGTFDLGEGQTLTINLGICAVEPLPEPTPGSTDFIIRIDTTLEDGLDSFTVGTNTVDFTYNYDVAWEEVGNPSNNGTLTGFTGSATINFDSPGQYDISISGLFPAYKASAGNLEKVIDIIQWGDNQWQSMNSAFTSCINLNNYSATDAPDLSSVTDMGYMFAYATQFNGDVSGWDVSNVTNMDSVFGWGLTSFNQDLSNWDVSSVTNMSNMFQGATQFNGDISGWNVSNVTNMGVMFASATSFNQDLSGWNVSSVTNMSFMFEGATQFNGDISGWDVSSVTDMSYMFGSAISFNGDISGWNVSNVILMNHMFSGATQFNGDIGSWNVSNVTNMFSMFSQATSFNQDISGWNVSSVTNMSFMFSSASSFNQDISSWNVSNVAVMNYMFNNATSFNQDLSGWCVSQIPFEPSQFADGATAWAQPKPVWGTCP